MSATITTLPTPPARTAPSTFSARMDAFLAAFPGFVTEANALAAEVEASAAALAAPGFNATSTTSLAVGTGTQSLTVQAAKSYVPGMSVKIAYTTDPTIWMYGDVVTYDTVTGALVVEVSLAAGSGTYTAWTTSLSSPLPGAVLSIETTAAHAATATELKAGATYTSSYAGETTVTLVAGASGYRFRGIVTVAQYLKFAAAGAEKFRYGSVQSAAGGYVRSNTVGNTIEADWSGTEWVITKLGGVWKYDE